jgi:hypothetical protein
LKARGDERRRPCICDIAFNFFAEDRMKKENQRHKLTRLGLTPLLAFSLMSSPGKASQLYADWLSEIPRGCSVLVPPVEIPDEVAQDGDTQAMWETERNMRWVMTGLDTEPLSAPIDLNDTEYSAFWEGLIAIGWRPTYYAGWKECAQDDPNMVPSPAPVEPPPPGSDIIATGLRPCLPEDGPNEICYRQLTEVVDWQQEQDDSYANDPRSLPEPP